MRRHDRIISLKLPSHLLLTIDQSAIKHQTNRSAFIRRAVEKALREETRGRGDINDRLNITSECASPAING